MQAVDTAILHALNLIVAESSKPTERTMERVGQLLNYVHTNPNANVRYHASDMILNVHSNASYLSAGRGEAVQEATFS